jgi:hypothetical protein
MWEGLWCCHLCPASMWLAEVGDRRRHAASHCRSTCGPPHEQLLMRLGQVVRRSFRIVVVIIPSPCFPSSLWSSGPSAHQCRCRLVAPAIHPAHSRSQAMGAGASSMLLVVAAPSHAARRHGSTRSTPRAVAREAGGGWVVHCPWSLLSLKTSVIAPTSNGS